MLILIPDLLLAILFLMLAVQTGWFPAGGMTSADFDSLSAAARAADLLWHLVLPVASAGPGNAAGAGAARALGLAGGPRFALRVRPPARKAFRCAGACSATCCRRPLNPLVSLFGISLGTLLSASLLVEVVMGWPGLGPLLLDAIMARDMAVVLAVVLLSAVLLVLGNLAGGSAALRSGSAHPGAEMKWRRRIIPPCT